MTTRSAQAEAFILECLHAVRSLPLCIAERVGPELICVEHGDLELQISLEGPLRQVELDPAAAPQLIAGLRARVEARLTEASRPDPSQIMPVLRAESLVSARWVGAVAPPAQPFSAGLWVSYALDLPLTRRILRRSDVDQLGLTDARLHTTALQNLTARAGRVELRRLRNGLLRVRLDGDNDAALLLLDHLWGERGVPGAASGLRAVVAADDVLLVVLGADADAWHTARVAATEAAAGSLHPLPLTELRRLEGRWVDASAPAPGPHH